MKIFIFTWDRYDSISTPAYFDASGIDDYHVLVHDRDKAEKFTTLNPKNIIVTYQPKGLAYNRNFALDLMQPDEWALFFVDDLISVTKLDDYSTHPGETVPVTTSNSTEWGRKFKAPITATEFMEMCKECTAKADAEGIKLVGFAGNNNALFRVNKWKYNALADGRCWLVKKTNLQFDINAQLIDDVCFTALNIKAFGKVLINQWILPDCKRYTAGAFGTIDQRMEQKIKECKYLVTTYPEYIQYAEKKGWPSGSHITISRKKNNLKGHINLFQ